ncbi:MAG: formate/nitrite transporter family protein [Syntrophomonadaceae bacterium]|nr:formate/nitrite transporter family protein [Syntrophomonadaceae bacterium]
MNFMTPGEIAAAAANAGKAKTELSFMKMVLLGILAGVYIGFGANLATKVGAAPDADSAMGIVLFGAVFSVGLMLVVICGAELFTGNNMACFISACNGQATWGGLLYNWVVVFFANFLGSLLLVYIIFQGGFWMAADPATGAIGLSAIGGKAAGIAKAKMSLTWGEAFCRAICCNWLVCLAVWLGFAAKDVVGKIFGIFFPIMAFVASGFEHSVANMFFIPMGITVANAAPAAAAEKFAMAPDAVASFFSYGTFISANLIPVTLGNIVGGALFVGGFYYLIYLRKK